MIDLLHPNLLREKLERTLAEKNSLFKHYFNATEVEFKPVYEKCLAYGEKLKPYITNVRQEILEAKKNGKSVLFEGAQGTLLDVDHGTYPYVTSSNTTAGGVLTGCGVEAPFLDQVIGITKAYTTRVGTGPFPTEIEVTEKATAEKIRAVGVEFGATTGRLRRVGWLDLVALRYAAEINGFTGLALMKVDVLNGFDAVRLCTSYELDGKSVNEVPACVEDMERLKPVYQTLPCWKSIDAASVKSLSDLPKELKDFIHIVEKAVGIPVVLVSMGPGREQTLQIRNPFNS